MKEEIHKELSEISPFLANLEKKDPFKAPKFYFDTLADKVLEKAQPEVAQAPPQYSKRPNILDSFLNEFAALWQPRWALAMAIVLFVAMGGWWFLKPQTTKPIADNIELTNEDIHQYIQENIHDFDETLLLENDKIAFDTEGGILQKADVSDDEIEQYLRDNIDEKDLEAIDN